MLVNFLDRVNNKLVGDWCPTWADLQELVGRSLEVEESNRGKWVRMVETIEERMIEWLPPRPIRRIDDAVITSYERPLLVAETDRENRFEHATHRLKLASVVAQDVLDFLITHSVQVNLVCRLDDAIQILVPIHQGAFASKRDASELASTSLYVKFDQVYEHRR